MKPDRRLNRRALLALPMQLWMAVFVGVALLYIIGLSLLGRGEALEVTGRLTGENYARLLDPKYFQVLWLSVRLAGLTTVLSLLLGYPFAYFMARASEKWRAWLMVLIIAPFWTNALIRIYGWKILLYANGPVNQALLALGLIQKPLKMLYTQGAVLLGMVYAMIPFVILPIYTGMERMDFSKVEAARDLGASPFRAFLTVTMPMTAPSLLAACVLTFLPSVGLIFLSDILGGANTVLWGNLVQDELLKSRDLPFAAALSAVLLLLTALVIVLYRRAGGKNEEMVF